MTGLLADPYSCPEDGDKVILESEHNLTQLSIYSITPSLAFLKVLCSTSGTGRSKITTGDISTTSPTTLEGVIRQQPD